MRISERNSVQRSVCRWVLLHTVKNMLIRAGLPLPYTSAEGVFNAVEQPSSLPWYNLLGRIDETPLSMGTFAFVAIRSAGYRVDNVVVLSRITQAETALSAALVEGTTLIEVDVDLTFIELASSMRFKHPTMPRHAHSKNNYARLANVIQSLFLMHQLLIIDCLVCRDDREKNDGSFKTRVLYFTRS